ncbi:MAG: ribonuclease III [Flavobacteriaceae bacterium]|nr:ribonuclease III [Flavobacteriaceae bacterium]
MNRIRRFISNFLTQKKGKTYSDKDLKFASDISKLLGFKIQNVELYREAFSLKNANRNASCRKNYERLEFLGDAVLGSIISYYLFKNYPNRNEGYLTQMKSKIVNRKNLNRLGEKLHLTKFIQNPNLSLLCGDIEGNLLESLIGAVYLDANYKTCEKIVEKWMLNPEEIKRLQHKVVSYKSLLLEWSQKKKVKIQYETIEENLPNKGIGFKSYVLLNDQKIVNASESSKKKAEEKAAQRAFYTLNKKENILEK